MAFAEVWRRNKAIVKNNLLKIHRQALQATVVSPSVGSYSSHSQLKSTKL